MKKFICSVFIFAFNLSILMLVLNCVYENTFCNAEMVFPEEFLSQTVEWEKCELFEDQKKLRKAECADITVPLYWEDPEGETITIHVKRLRALFRATKQMWLLDGGPGGAGTARLPQLMQDIAQLDWRTDLYTLDHRGTGNSNRLSCPDQEAENSEGGIWITESEGAACIDYVEANYNNLDSFTVAQAAKDLGFLVALLKEENKEIFIYGWSYGTYWGHRYAQIFPDQADGIVLDSVLPSVMQGDQWDILGNEVANDFFEICKEDDFCRSKMGDDPWGKAEEILEKYKNGYCQEVVETGLTPEYLQTYSARALDYWNYRIILPVLYYRIDRCSEADVRAFEHFMNVFLSFFPPLTARSFSDVLRQHIQLSELIGENHMSAGDAKIIDASLVATEHSVATGLSILEKGWPTYETGEYYQGWAPPEVPILMINGTLDRVTPIVMASLARENLTGPHQYFVEAHNINHVVIMSSSVKKIFAPHCGMQIVLDYMNDPLKEPDTSCLGNLIPINFRGDPLMALMVFGTWDLWGK